MEKQLIPSYMWLAVETLRARILYASLMRRLGVGPGPRPP
jgi:hypothetical protein